MVRKDTGELNVVQGLDINPGTMKDSVSVTTIAAGENQKDDQAGNDRVILAVVLDRLFLVVYLSINLVASTIIFVQYAME